jgi:phage terminase large subunit-like protein
MARTKLAEELLGLEPAERRATLARMTKRQRGALHHHWRLWAHDGQAVPVDGWYTWLVMGGRGFGKTRAGAEWVREIAEADPTARIALVAASLGEARRVMVEGDSGLLAIAPPRQRPAFEPSKRRLTWPKGAQATLYSAGEPESLRGPQHSHATVAVLSADHAGEPLWVRQVGSFALSPPLLLTTIV